MRTDNVPVVKTVALMGVLITAAMLLLTAWVWTRFPEDARVPVHWGASGQVDRYGSKTEGLLGLPITALALTALVAALPLFEPRRSNLLRSSKAYAATCLAFFLFLLCLHAAAVMETLGKRVSVPSVAIGAAGILFAVIGNYLGKTRSNFFYGIRTPWTLSSELSWTKTHRIGGKLFVAIGLLVLAGAFLLSEGPQLVVFLGGTLGASAFLVVYSYFAWKNDPARLPTGSQKASPPPDDL
ncbi:MAG: SdpI family protein [Verrucomicrobiota bacterium]